MTWSDPPFGPAVAGRGLRVTLEITTRASGAAWAPKDISASRWSYQLRAWLPSDRTTLVVNDTVAKGSATGWIDDYVPLGDDVKDQMEWELVEIDSAGNDVDTPSGYREVQLLRWRQAIEAAYVG